MLNYQRVYHAGAKEKDLTVDFNALLKYRTYYIRSISIGLRPTNITNVCCAPKPNLKRDLKRDAVRAAWCFFDGRNLDFQHGQYLVCFDETTAPTIATDLVSSHIRTTACDVVEVAVRP